MILVYDADECVCVKLWCGGDWQTDKWTKHLAAQDDKVCQSKTKVDFTLDREEESEWEILSK